MTMNKIKLLDEDTINKIAAGEVIERPASVVKELVENSIDAGAARILIEVEDGGKRLIKVTDDGCGIEPDDLPMAFQKHATSKISGAGDLDNVKTMGFRGEALSSIASIARSVEVHTKPRSALTGTYMLIENGEIRETKEIGCPIGTSISVKDLFYNIPARRKHLKSAESELAHIADIITELAIINHGTSFELFSGRRTLFKSKRSQSWDDVLLRILGLKTVKGLVPFRAQSKECIISGMAGDPLSTRSSPDRIFIYVNGRAVYSKMLSAALREAYRAIIPQGRSPIAVVSLEVNPSLVDVNIHPTKREIRLLKEGEISALLTGVVSAALKTGADVRPLGEAPRTELPEMTAGLVRDSEQRTLAMDPAADAGEDVLPIKPEYECEGEDEEAPRLRILGQVLELYILAESDDGLMLIDQHAAAERIRFERLSKLYETKSIAQELAEPVIVELAPNEAILLDSWGETLAELGFEISAFGGNAYSVRSVPALGKRLESPEAVHDILSDLFAMGKVMPDATFREDVLKLLACRGSIKSGRALSHEEMRTLLQDLFACESPLTCPHGRPVAVLIRPEELERLFYRR
jgi:DNA mismatch repair protein MutL